MVGLALGALIVGAHVSPSQGFVVVVVLLSVLVLFGARRLGTSTALAAVLMLLLASLMAWACWWGQPRPRPLDPAHQLPLDSSIAPGSKRPQKPQLLEGTALRDSKQFQDSCRLLVATQRLDSRPIKGRTEVHLQPCQQPLKLGSRIRFYGQLRAPSLGPHPLLPGPAERLEQQGSWSQFTADQAELLSRSWTPFADARRQVARRFQALMGPRSGGLLAALVLGSAQVDLPIDLRQMFRVAGLSHALAASGFHLSILLGTTLAIAKLLPKALRLPLAVLALLSFLILAGVQPSVVRAVLMASTALLIHEGGERSRPFGVLLLTLVLMLLVNPSWARSIGFQLSAAATAGLLISAPSFQQALASRLPTWLAWLASALAVPLAALLWTLPLQLLHFGSTPLYALLANLLAAPLLVPLTLAAMALALLCLLLPGSLAMAILPWVSWPVQQLALLLIGLVHWISLWPGAQLLTGHPQPWLVLLLALALVPWLMIGLRQWRPWAGLVLMFCLLVQAFVQLSDGLLVVHQYGRQWLLARHRGRAALVSTHGDDLSCRQAGKLSEAFGHGRLDWVMVTDPVASQATTCWQQLAHTVVTEHQGLMPLRPGQRLASSGLAIRPLDDSGQVLQLQVGRHRWRLLATTQAFWRWRYQQRSALTSRLQSSKAAAVKGTWLGFMPSPSQRGWLKRYKAGRLWIRDGASGSATMLGATL